MLIGLHILGWVAASDASRLLSELGVVFPMFSVGLATRPGKILEVGVTSICVATLGVILPLAAGNAPMRTPPFAGGISNIFTGRVGLGACATAARFKK